MILKYNINVSDDDIRKDIKRIINQVYKLLPLREQGKDWKKPLQTIIEQLAGMQRLFLGQQEQSFFRLLCKLEGMNILIDEEQFSLYRRIIFECLSLLNDISSCLMN